MSFPPPNPWDPRYTLECEVILVDWNCPMCGTPTPRTRRPGRPRVYCTNSCRQRAYRDRRRRGVRLLCGDGQPCERSFGRRVEHLMRAPGDVVADRRASNRRAVSLCGAFVRPARDHPDPYTDFAFDHVYACYTCLELTGAARPDPPMQYPWQTARRSYTGPPLAKFPAPPMMAERLRGAPKRRVA